MPQARGQFEFVGHSDGTVWCRRKGQTKESKVYEGGLGIAYFYWGKDNISECKMWFNDEDCARIDRMMETSKRLKEAIGGLR